MTKEYKSYYPNGRVLTHYFYKDGYLHGEFKTYYSNGQLEFHCFYKNMLKHGEYKTYYTDGSSQFWAIYVDDELLDINPATISNKDKLALKLKYDIEFLPE